MAEIKVTRIQLMSIVKQLEKSDPSELLKVISLLSIASYHVEEVIHPARASTLYLLTLTRKVMEKYHDMISLRPKLASTKMNENFRKHICRVVIQLTRLASEI